MNTQGPSNNIEHLAQLARETCVYRGRQQQADFTASILDSVQPAQVANPFQRLVSSLKR